MRGLEKRQNGPWKAGLGTSIGTVSLRAARALIGPSRRVAASGMSADTVSAKI